VAHLVEVFVFDLSECLVKGLAHRWRAARPNTLKILGLVLVELLANVVSGPSCLVLLGEPNHELEVRDFVPSAEVFKLPAQLQANGLLLVEEGHVEDELEAISDKLRLIDLHGILLGGLHVSESLSGDTTHQVHKR
jgi:hypothetical protein